MSAKNSLRNTILGGIFVAIGEICFATNNSLIKYSNLKESQILYCRFGIQLIFAILWWNINRPKTVTNWYGDYPDRRNIWIRGAAYSIGAILGFYAFIRLPVGDASCILNQNPLFTAILARIFLKEELPKTTPIIIVLCF